MKCHFYKVTHGEHELTVNNLELLDCCLDLRGLQHLCIFIPWLLLCIPWWWECGMLTDNITAPCAMEEIVYQQAASWGKETLRKAGSSGTKPQHRAQRISIAIFRSLSLWCEPQKEKSWGKSLEHFWGHSHTHSLKRLLKWIDFKLWSLSERGRYYLKK